MSVFPPALEAEPVAEPTFLDRNNIHPVVFGLACLLVVFILYQLLAGTATVLIIGSAKVTRDNAFLFRTLTMVGQILFILLPTLWFAKLMAVRPSSVFPWRAPKGLELVFALVSLMFLQQFLQVYLVLQDRIPFPPEIQELLGPLKTMMEELFRSLVTAESIPELLYVLFIVAVVPSVVEEMFFRGVIQRSFELVLPASMAAMAAGMIFGLYHLNIFAVVPLMALGVFFGLLRLRSRSILVPMTAHFVNNTLAVLAVWFNLDDEILIGGGGGEPAVPLLLAQLVLFGLLFAVGFSVYLWLTARINSAGKAEEPS